MMGLTMVVHMRRERTVGGRGLLARISTRLAVLLLDLAVPSPRLAELDADRPRVRPRDRRGTIWRLRPAPMGVALRRCGCARRPGFICRARASSAAACTTWKRYTALRTSLGGQRQRDHRGAQQAVPARKNSCATSGAGGEPAKFEGETDRLGRAAELTCGRRPRQLMGSRGCLGNGAGRAARVLRDASMRDSVIFPSRSATTLRGSRSVTARETVNKPLLRLNVSRRCGGALRPVQAARNAAPRCLLTWARGGYSAKPPVGQVQLRPKRVTATRGSRRWGQVKS